MTDQFPITTGNSFPERETMQTLGEVFGLTVRSRNIGSSIGSGFKSLVGGELKGLTKSLATSRTEAVERMIDEATAKGANAIVAMRFDTSAMGDVFTEVCAYGTAVVLAAADSQP
jgi:uncharacterized protein YbjQ (UPF0145 family)